MALRITVVVASFRRPEFLAKCLESLESQTRPPDEVVVVARTDDVKTQEVVLGKEEGGILKLAMVEEPGIVAAENRGLREAGGDIVCLMDDDAEALPDWLELIESHYADPEVGAVGGPSVPFVDGRPVYLHHSGRVMVYTWYGRHIGNSDRIPNAVKDVHFLRGCNMSFRRGLVEEFDPRLLRYWSRFEDDVILPIHRRGYRVLYDPRIQVHHHIAPVQEGETRAQDPLAIFGSHHNNTYVLLKHGNPIANTIFLAFTYLVGDRFNPGVLFSVARGVVKRRLLQEMRNLLWGLRGKTAGIRTYLGWKTGNPQ